MPKSSVIAAAELYIEQRDALKKLNGRKDESVLNEIYDTQNRYDACVRELAQKPEIVQAIPDLAKLGGGYIFQYAAWHIVLVSQNLDVLEQMFQMRFTPEIAWDFGNMLNLLEDHEADVIINHLKTYPESKIGYFWLVNDYIGHNYRQKHLDLFVRNGAEFGNSIYGRTISRFKTPEVISIFENKPKSSIIYELGHMLLLQMSKAWDYACSKRIISDNNGYDIATFGGYQDLLKLMAYIDGSKSMTTKLRILPSIAQSGDIRALTWLFKQLDNPAQTYRANVFFTMCDLLYHEIQVHPTAPEFDDIDEVLENFHAKERQLNKTEFPEFSTENLQKLWSDVMPYIKTIREEGKYYSSDDGKEFDMLKELRRLRYADRYEIGDFILDKLTIWTGEYLPFDPHAYFKKQEAQFEAWEQFLLDNREKFAPGYRYRWGERVS